MARYIASEMGYFLLPFLLCAASGFSIEILFKSSGYQIFLYLIIVIMSVLPVIALIEENRSGRNFGAVVAVGFIFGWFSAYASCRPRSLPDPDERFFEMANAEFENGRNTALWVKCVTMARGDEAAARYRYIEEIARRLGWKGAFRPHRSGSLVYDDASFFRRLLRGDYGLAKTFWLGLVCWRVFGNIAIQALVPDKFTPYHQKVLLLKTIPLALFVLIVVDIILVISTWKASSAYQGPFLWTVLTRVFLIAGTSFGFAVTALYAIDLLT